MNDKDTILQNVDQYSAQQLVDFVNQGRVTLDELIHNTDGKFSQSKRLEVTRLLSNGDEEMFNRVKSERTLEICRKYLDTYPGGKFRQEVRDIMYEIEDATQLQDDQDSAESAWHNVSYRDKESLKEFINTYPNSYHVQEATQLLNELLIDELMQGDIDSLVDDIIDIQTKAGDSEQKENQILELIKRSLSGGKISKKAFLDKLQNDINLLSAGVVRKLINEDIISIQDLISLNIEDDYIRMMMKKIPQVTFDAPEKLEKIHKQSTEVYFWGLPSSGKSCVLGAIFSVAASGKIAKSMDCDTGSQGYGYMTRLINLFQDGKICTLMAGTALEDFYEMGFDLEDMNGKIHPITCIDMAGELMKCLYKSNANNSLDISEDEMLDTLTKVLIDNRSTNRKMHIFVIEYGAEEKLYEGLPQKAYLDAALSYIKNTGIFRKDTDAIYIMITKTDKIKNPTSEKLNNYINEHYLGFYNSLERICKENEINKGKVEKIAFSLGDVCFQRYCRFNAKAAENVVRLLLSRSVSYKRGKLGKLGRIIRG